MFIPTDTAPAAWDSTHRKLLADFLASDVGVLALAWVAHHAPSLLDGADVNRTLVASGEVKGYTQAISELISLTRDQPVEVQPPVSYPDLDDDSKWKYLDEKAT